MSEQQNSPTWRNPAVIGMGRYIIGGWAAERWGTSFPLGTLIINLSGSLLLGIFLTYATDRALVDPRYRQFAAIGFLGAYTTFSTYTFESVTLMLNGSWGAGLFNLFGSSVADRNLKRLPVVDTSGRLTGILSRVDVLRTIAEARPAKSGARQPVSAGHTVADVMDTEVPSVKEDADLVEIVNVMVGTEVKRVVVLDGAGRAMGVITDGDLVARVRPEARAGLLAALTRRGQTPKADVLARDLMSPDVLKGLPETPIAEAVRQMLAQKRKRFYVVDAEGKPLGTVDRQTLLLAVAGLAATNET